MFRFRTAHLMTLVLLAGIPVSTVTAASIQVGFSPEGTAQAERIASTIRHNRARGKHQIASMSDIVRDLARLGWADERIGKELGMDRDEVLRLKQISGLTELFEEEDFSPAWTVR